jgi:hypothetical protein
MANTLGVYNPTWYSKEALKILMNNLGMANTVHRRLEGEKSREPGETLKIRRPSTFSAADAPATAADLNTQTATVTLAYWREVKFKLTDKELAFTGDQIITDHIAPAAYALADDIDTKLALLYKDIPWMDSLTATAVPADIVKARRLLFNNKVPVNDTPNMFGMINGTVEEELLGNAAFSQQQGAGDVGIAAQIKGTLGPKYGFNMFANQNVQTHTSGTCADATGALTADAALGATSIAVDAVTDGGTAKAGDHLIITGDSQRYAITADVTFTGAAGTISIDPPLRAAALDNAVVTIDVTGTATANCLFYHRNAFALVMAPLPETGNELGARVATVSDPVTKLSLRSRLYYVGNSSEVHVAIDCLYGVETLDNNMCYRMQEA